MGGIEAHTFYRDSCQITGVRIIELPPIINRPKQADLLQMHSFLIFEGNQSGEALD